MKLFCKHKWEVLVDTTTESAFQHVCYHLRNTLGAANHADIPGHLCDASRKRITILTCEKCGKVKKFVEGI